MSSRLSYPRFDNTAVLTEWLACYQQQMYLNYKTVYYTSISYTINISSL